MSITTTPEISIEALRSGSRAEFARMVDVHSPLIYRLGLKMLGNPQDAEDVLQNTFLNALTHLPDFEGRSSVSTWLYRIASNEALMMLRKKRPLNIEDLQAENSDEGMVPEIFVDWSALPEGELLAGESKNVIDDAVAKLPEQLRIVFVLRDIEGISIRETAEILSLTETNVKTRLLRARMALREKLSAYYGEQRQTHASKGKNEPSSPR
ncbi:MAG TPA: sigma-70 family RNA polymerase sigma factor [Anaerolineales bacterium]|nr:sigma-70 family RNA polymerase sigma factor [Anaerolineales bacterium]HNH77750.1 sigma-70 family RNA polymerase sigma factor [Anaerolineales bacterium]